MNLRITNNFVPYEGNLSPEQHLRKMWADGKVHYDKRNGIYCCNPTYDFDCIINYYSLLDMASSSWKPDVPYMDAGLVPVIYLPSFMQSNIKVYDQFRKYIYMITKGQIEFIEFPATTFLQDNFSSAYKDTWCWRKDLAKFLGKSEFSRLTTELYRRISNEIGTTV